MSLKLIPHTLRLACLLLMSLCAFTAAAAESKTLLIINSYDDKEPWVDDLSEAIILHTAAAPGVKCHIVDLNSAFAPDSTAFWELTDDIIRSVGDNKPSYMVMIGNLAFNMRVRIREAWGNIPLLLVTKVRGIAPLGDYFGKTDPLQSLGEFRIADGEDANYNFTAIAVPSFYEETIRMMDEMLPDMKELVFISDDVYYNRHTAGCISEYLQNHFPQVKFKWEKTSIANTDMVQQYFENEMKDTGLLISSMSHNSISNNSQVYSYTNDMRLISYSKNPVFTLSESNIRYGAVGGAFPDEKYLAQKAVEVLDQMFAGKDMRDIPICEIDRYETIVNYPSLKKYHLHTSDCPDGTIFYEKPKTFLEQYFWLAMVALSLLVLIFVIAYGQITSQRRYMRSFNRNVNFINSMPVPYAATKVHFGKDGKITKFEYRMKNDAFERIVNDNCITGGPSLLFPADFICPKVEELLRTREPLTFTYHFPRSDTYYTFIFRLAENSSFDRSPKSSLMDVFALDYTERHHIEWKLRKLARRLDVTLESARRDPFTFDISGGQVEYDTYIREDSSDVRRNVTLNFESRMDLVHPADRHLFTELIYDRRVEDGDKFDFEYRRKRPGSTDYDQWMEISGSIEKFNEYGRPARLIGSLRDITSRKQREQQLEEALRRASESDTMKSAFLANVSHEIRTPLNSIIGFSNVMAHTDDAGERVELWQRIKQSNRQLLMLIDDVMDLAKLEANMVDLDYELTDINALLDGVRNEFAGSVADGVTLNVIQGAENCKAMVDPLRIRQVLGNMLGNACKFTDKGSITMGFDILDDSVLNFYVKDTGRGIPENDIPRLFDRFFKGDPFVPGTGLGLPICKNIIEKMGGRIGVISDGPGTGSTFWFEIPFEEE